MFANRFNFDSDKIVLEYREPLPEDITSITALPLGRRRLYRRIRAACP